MSHYDDKENGVPVSSVDTSTSPKTSMHGMMSDIARLRQQIVTEQLAAQRGLSGLAAGYSRHDFIEQRTENIGRSFAELSDLVGSQQAIQIVAETLTNLPSLPLQEEA